MKELYLLLNSIALKSLLHSPLHINYHINYKQKIVYLRGFNAIGNINIMMAS